MPNKNDAKHEFAESDLTMPDNFIDRRKKARQKDLLYQLVVALNVTAWIFLIGALILLHYARPEFITGVQNYWGIEGREFWSEDKLSYLLTVLQVCLIITVITIVLRSRRNRRKTDRFGINILILLVISVTSLVTIYMTV